MYTYCICNYFETITTKLKYICSYFIYNMYPIYLYAIALNALYIHVTWIKHEKQNSIWV